MLSIEWTMPTFFDQKLLSSVGFSYYIILRCLLGGDCSYQFLIAQDTNKELDKYLNNNLLLTAFLPPWSLLYYINVRGELIVGNSKTCKLQKVLTMHFIVKCADNLDDDIREESHSEDEESSSSSDEMSFERSNQYTHSNRSRSSEDPVSFSNRRSADMSMPGSSILESIDTPPPFRKRSLAMSQDEKQRQPSEISQNSSSFQTTNGQLCKCLKLLKVLSVYTKFPSVHS